MIRSDVVRKELAGVAAERAAASVLRGEGIYAPEWTERTYAECLRRAEALLFEGERVLVDASFREEAKRRPFLEAADAVGRAGASCSSARPSRPWCGSAWRAAGATPPTPTGRSISRPPSAGRSPAPHPPRPPGDRQ